MRNGGAVAPCIGVPAGEDEPVHVIRSKRAPRSARNSGRCLESGLPCLFLIYPDIIDLVPCGEHGLRWIAPEERRANRHTVAGERPSIILHLCQNEYDSLDIPGATSSSLPHAPRQDAVIRELRFVQRSIWEASILCTNSIFWTNVPQSSLPRLS